MTFYLGTIFSSGTLLSTFLNWLTYLIIFTTEILSFFYLFHLLSKIFVLIIVSLYWFMFRDGHEIGGHQGASLGCVKVLGFYVVWHDLLVGANLCVGSFGHWKASMLRSLILNSLPTCVSSQILLLQITIRCQLLASVIIAIGNQWTFAFFFDCMYLCPTSFVSSRYLSAGIQFLDVCAWSAWRLNHFFHCIVALLSQVAAVGAV